MNSIVTGIKTSDLKLFFLLNHRFNCRPLDIIMLVVTQTGSLAFTIVVTLILLVSALVITGLQMAIVLVISQLLVHLIKRLVNRPRPYRSMDNVIAKKPPLCVYSFPSGHTCAAFAMALVLSSCFPGLELVFLSLATLVGLSRIYLGAHYPTDVLVGFLIAYGSFVLGDSVIFSSIF